MSPAARENKHSSLLSTDENLMVLKLLGQGCQSLATAVVQVYKTQAPHHSQWVLRNTGVLCFTKDNQRRNYFFRLYCIKNNRLVWEQELYNDIQYNTDRSFLHVFEGDDCMVAINFASDDEAREMKIWVNNKIEAKQRRDMKRARQATTNNNHVSNVTQNNNNKVSMHNLVPNFDHLGQKTKRRRNLTKADISNPTDFVHVSHVGWDPEKGFDVSSKDEALTQFLAKAGVSEKHMKDRATREFIYDFIETHGGRDAVVEEQKTKKPAVPPSPASAQGPPVPPRSSTRSAHNRTAPPPPPPSITQQQQQQPQHSQPPPRPPPAPKMLAANNAVAPPSPAINSAPMPPPPPPMADISPPPPPMPTFAVEPQTHERNALLESIRSGTTLKPVSSDVERKAGGEDTRGNLMCEIRKGFQLKPANEREVKQISPTEGQANGGNDLAAALSRALAERNRVIHPDEDDDTSSSDSNDEEWET